MKRTLLSLAALVLVLGAPQRAKSDDVSVDFFYNNLSGGSWVEVGDYGYCWQPDVAVSNTEWRPYADGYWAYTDLGWTWVSYEDFGWATYHYGRWARINDYGWVWVPGRDAELEWGPAWVSWRTGGEYIGWAPLPPETITVVEGRPLAGQLDVEFNIGPSYYNFVEVRYIGEPVLRERIVPVTQNVTYIQQTVNVTNITYKNKVVYNYGPDITVVNRSSTRPIQRLRLDRQENVDVSAAAKSGGLTKVQGDKLVVAAPMRITKSNRQVAPPAVKTKVESAKIDRGWSGVGDEKAQAEFKQKIKNQDLKKVPPMAADAGTAGQANVNTGVSPAAGSSPAASAAGASTQTGKEPDRNRRGDRQGAGRAAAGGSPAAGSSPAESASPAAGTSSETMSGGRGQGQGQGQGQGRNRNRPSQPMDQNAPAGGSPAQAPPNAETGAASSTNTGEYQGRGGRGRNSGRNEPGATPHNEGAAPGVSGPSNAASEGSANQGQRQGRRGGRQAESQGANAGSGDASENAQGQGARQGRQRGQEEGQNAGSGEGHQGQGQGQAQGQGQGQESRGGKKGKVQASPSASPQ